MPRTLRDLLLNGAKGINIVESSTGKHYRLGEGGIVKVTLRVTYYGSSEVVEVEGNLSDLEYTIDPRKPNT